MDNKRLPNYALQYKPMLCKNIEKTTKKTTVKSIGFFVIREGQKKAAEYKDGGTADKKTEKNCVGETLSTAPTQMSNPDPLCRRNQLQRG
jgi:hypothetical protein